MSLERYSGGPNPFLIAGKLVDKIGQGRKDPTQQANHAEVLQGHVEYANTIHRHALEMHSAQVDSRIREISEYHKMAEPGTPVQVQLGEATVSMVKKMPKPRAPKTPKKTPRPLPVRDPKTGRAMRAPE